MKRWLIRRLGGVTKEQHVRLYHQYLDTIAEFSRAIERHEMQGAWTQIKAERKARRLN